MLDWIDESLREDREEALERGEIVASEAAVETCRRIVCHVPFPFLPGLNRAVFSESDGGVSLVLCSPINDCRADFRIPADGMNVSIVLVDDGQGAVVRQLGDVELKQVVLLVLGFLDRTITLAQWELAIKVAPMDDSRESIYGESEDR